MPQLGSSAVAMLLYACSILGTKSGRLVRPLVEAAYGFMTEFSAQVSSARGWHLMLWVW